MSLKDNKLIITIDASSTSHFGGGMTYLKNLIRNIDNNVEFQIISSRKVAANIEYQKNITFISHPLLNKDLISRVIFQLFFLDKLINEKSSILLSLSGDYSGSFKPYIGVCQNMLLYEWKKTEGMNFFERIKFKILRYRQIKSFNNSNGVIFLSKYAKKTVTKHLVEINSSVINFGISKRFFMDKKVKSKSKKIKFLYVSSIHTYKNQLNLLYAFKEVLKFNRNICLKLIGPILSIKYFKKVENLMNEINNVDTVVTYKPLVSYNEIHNEYSSSDIFIFPSICENMPNILIEAMASNLPIISSKTEPMPEFLKKNALYFNPLDIDSIAKKILYSIDNLDELNKTAKKNVLNAKKYTWQNTATETLSFIEKIIKDV